MNGAKTISAILGQPWLISPEFVANNLTLINAIMEGKVNVDNTRENGDVNVAAYMSNESGVQTVRPYYDYKVGGYNIPRVEEGASILNLNIDQAILRHDSCEDIGSLNYAALLNLASTRDDIAGIFLQINSPGGMASGTQVFAEAIRNCAKPVYAYIEDGIAASAGYWIASQCDKIYVSNSTCAVGSIGAYLTFMDVRGYYEKEGVKMHEVYSRLSEEKNKTFFEARDGNYAGLQDDLDFLVTEFIAQVNSARTINTAAGDPMKGAMYYADKATEIGLIDGIRTKAEAMTELYTMTTVTKKTKYYV